MKYKFLEDIAIAEAAFEAYGKTEEELFENCGEALFEIMADTKKIEPKKAVEIKLSGTTLEELLFRWLSELVFLKDAKEMVFGKFEVKIKKENEFKLNAMAFGESIKYPDQRLRNDVKAVTKHLFEIKKENGKFKAVIVIDI